MKNTNDLKVFSLAVFGDGIIAGKGTNGPASGGGTQSPPFSPGFTKTIEVIDYNGNPIVSAHVKWDAKGTITNAAGEATINVPTQSTEVTISYMGKRTHIATFENLGSLITLQDQVNSLPPVVVGQPKPPVTTTTTPKPTTPTTTMVKKTNWVKTAGIGLGAILLISALSGKKKGLNAPKPKKKKSGKKAKAKTKSKAKKKGLREPAYPTIEL